MIVSLQSLLWYFEIPIAGSPHLHSTQDARNYCHLIDQELGIECKALSMNGIFLSLDEALLVHRRFCHQ